ncbi:MAG: 16S rRNA (adenine(1518)-N(6)/adenine(1519)-N(6))-dimethyltransferase RsmA [Candidatus Micrarchaeota archaeon]
MSKAHPAQIHTNPNKLDSGQQALVRARHLIKGIGPKKRLGQNFLIDLRVIEREIAYCKPDGKRILEIGPGLGAITHGLAEKASHLTAVELDARFIYSLKDRLKQFNNVEIVHGDILEFNGGQFDVIISNLPYYIASKILFKIADMDFGFAIVCLQSELAERMVARPASRGYSRFSVMCQFLFDTELLERVPSGAFYPEPKVESSIVRISKTGTVSKALSLFINAIFQHRNKKLRNAITDSRGMLGIDEKLARKKTASMSLRDRRVITLSKEEILETFAEYSA